MLSYAQITLDKRETIMIHDTVLQRTYSEHVVSLLAVKKHCYGLMLDGTYDYYAAFLFFLSIPVGESFPIPSATEPPSSFEDFYP